MEQVKFNKYAHLIEIEEQGYLYHLVTGQSCALQKDILNIVAANFHTPGHLSELHPELYAALSQADFIVDYNRDETAELINSFTENESDPRLFEIMVNPTLDCNLRCWYCYEEHLKGTDMKPDTLKALKRLIDRKVESQELKHLAVTFFGGEPLLRWNDVVRPLIEYSSNRCKKKELGFNTGFTTNGFLLTRDKFEFLDKLGLKGTSFQISFDGNRERHNKSRVYDADHPTFDRMLKAIYLGAEMGFNMCVRFNYTPDSLDSFNDVIDEMGDWEENLKKHITVNFQQVWQTSKDIANDTKGLAAAMRQRVRDLGMNTDCDLIYHRHVCYADRPNCILVNYNGDVFKCSARKFDPSMREGELRVDGTITYNERYDSRMAIKYSNPSCQKCMIMPICNGRCSQSKLETTDRSSCYLGMDAARRERYLVGSLISQLTEAALPDSALREVKITRHLYPQQ